MRLIKYITFSLLIVLAIAGLQGCNAIGMLLFYKEIKTETIYRSSTSKKNYYTIKAVTLSHCGCTDLMIDNYKIGNKEFRIELRFTGTRKLIYTFNPQLKRRDTTRLVATPNAYSINFDSLDREIFRVVDSLIVAKPKGMIYPPKRVAYKGYNKELNLYY